VAYLKRTLDPVFGWPGIVRFSWATAKTMMEDKARPPPTGTSTASHGRQSRSSSRTQSLTDAPSDHAAAVQHTASRSIFGTPLPIGPTATRTYKVRWMDEPVKISKFFGKLSKSAAQTTAPHPGPDPDPEDPFRVSEAQQAVDAFLRQEPEWRAKNTPALASPMVGKLQRDLGHTSSGANFLTSPR
jgi:ribonuclease H2 subunit A